jgi:hypothetical protein
MTEPTLSTSECTVPGPATRPNTPTATSRIDGIVRNALYAIADASVGTLSATAFFAARTKIVR